MPKKSTDKNKRGGGEGGGTLHFRIFFQSLSASPPKNMCTPLVKPLAIPTLIPHTRTRARTQ